MGRVRHVMVMLLALVATCAAAQTTKVRGRVTDSSDGEGIPFAAVYFKGTGIGVTSDLDGYYYLESRDVPTDTLCVQILGYETVERRIHLHGFNIADFQIAVTNTKLTASMVKPDNRRMKRILKLIDRNRDRNNPEKKEAYKCDIYNKMELDLTNAKDQKWGRTFMNNFGFVFEYMDTSSLNGMPCLPVMISETRGRRYHTRTPSMDKEILEASRISGLNKDNFLQQFTGSLRLKVNLYDPFINAFNVNIPSPISANGNAYYNYFLIDSLNVNGRKTYYIRFHPNRMFTSPVLDGEMSIDAEEGALVAFRGRMVKERSLNWVRDMSIEMEFQRTEEGSWFYKTDRMQADFSLTLRDSSDMISFIGSRELHYMNPSFERPTEEESRSLKHFVTVLPGANDRDEEYWEAERPYMLSSKEKDIYRMVDTIKTIPLYKRTYKFLETVEEDYFDFGKLGYGPVFSTLSYNRTEGVRLRAGLRTTTEFSKKLRMSAYAAYGTRDRKIKGGAKMEYLFSKDLFRKLTVEARKDFIQLGNGNGQYEESNIIESILTRQGGTRKSPYEELTIRYEHEWPAVVNNTFALETRRIHSNEFVPMVTPDGDVIPYVKMTQAHLTTRFSWEESVSRGNFNKVSLYSKYPVISLDIMGSVKGLLNDYGYLRTELRGSYRMPMPPIGFAKIRFNAGYIYGSVPYPFLKLHAGNASYILSTHAFSCMGYYEFASDKWAELFYEHNFGGFFLGHIPLLKKLNLREMFSVKCAWGSLSEKNNGIPGQDGDAPMLFPADMSSLEKPYVEIAAGVSNIFKLFRIDGNWRLTHRKTGLPDGTSRKADNLFTVTLGLELEF